ncbi:hypothetical protein niasHT_031273 [Heterodera trifolii]|uniref:DNA-directed DNA polymerase n=1 Tax=Heterodera trifolii TaxID=157864 RepID=A0ABD2IKY1_9BILA
MSLEDHNYCGELGGNETPPKRRRRNDDDDGEQKFQKSCIRTLSADKQYNQKFKVQSVKSTFVIENLPANPEAMLRALFAHCMSTALDESQQNGITPDQLGATISSDLLNPSIWIPIRRISDNTADSIMNRFLEVAQSKSREGSLWGSPFTVTITTLDVAQLPQRQQVRGSGKRTPYSVQHIVKESALLRINNSDDAYCLFYALETSRKYHSKEMPRRNFCYYINRQNGRRLEDVFGLMSGANIRTDLREYDAVVYVPIVVDYWNRKYATANQRFKVFIFGATGTYRPKFQYGPDNFNIEIPLYHHNGHFDGIRCGVGKAVFGRDYYCFSCECPYDNANDHTLQCKAKCINCGRIGMGRPCRADDNNNNNYYIECAACGKDFMSQDCFNHHLSSNVCRQFNKCKQCGVVWNVRQNRRKGRSGHVCGEKFCYTCKCYHKPERGCFIQQLKARRPKKYRLIAFDCETTQNTRIEGSGDRRLHSVNFISCHVACTKCIEENSWRNSLQVPCSICGRQRTVTFSHSGYERTQTDAQFITPCPMAAFAQWLLREFDPRYPTMLFAHFGGRFDNIMLFRQFFLSGFCPQMIRRGNKLYEMKIARGEKNPEIIVRDSWNLMPVPLGALPGAFGLSVQDKEFFPHLANVEANYGRILQSLPPKADYLYGGMTPDRQRRFDQWYAAHHHQQFDLCEQLAAYCTNDTHILVEALVAFRTEFLAISDPLERHGCLDDEDDDDEEEEQEENDTAFEVLGGGIDITWEPMTIASASMRHFRLNHLKRDQLAIVPECGYDTTNTQSLIALKFLDWYAKRNGVSIQTAHSPGGEKKIGQYTVDGYIAATDTVIEVNGCHWHAHDHPRHRFQPQTVMANGKNSAADTGGRCATAVLHHIPGATSARILGV